MFTPKIVTLAQESAAMSDAIKIVENADTQVWKDTPDIKSIGRVKVLSVKQYLSDRQQVFGMLAIVRSAE